MNTQKRTSIIQLLALFVPLFMVFWITYPIENHLIIHWVVYVFSLVVLGIVIYERWSLKKLGIRTDNIRETLVPYTLFTIVGLGVIFVFAFFLDRNTAIEWWLYPHFQYGFLVTSVLQEVMFRGFLMPKLKNIFSSAWHVIGANGLLFALIHVVFPDPLLLFPLGLISGIAFAAMYYYYPNLILIALSHSILNFFAMLHCFFSISIQC